MRALRIAIVAPPWFAVPPSGYGGIEWVVSHLADGLVDRGHDVTLFAAGGSRTRAKLVVTYDTPPSAALGDPIVEASHHARAYARSREFDVIHDHTILGLLAASGSGLSVVHTVHGEVLPAIARLYRDLADRVDYVTVSHNQAGTMPEGCRTTTIYNGVDLALYPMAATQDDYLLFVGRMCREKGILPAIEIARRSGRRLIVLAKVNEAAERAYYDELVRPALRGIDAEVRQHATLEEKARLYAGAYATLFPIQWPEPFGLVMTESMAAGTPVIAFDAGSVREVIADGRTGFICRSVDEATEALERVPGIDRAACRRHVQEHFSIERNVLAHEALYDSLVRAREVGRPAGQVRLPMGARIPAFSLLPEGAPAP